MAERMNIDFFEEIDLDLLKYAFAFRKCGFSSSVTLTMKYWREQDFQNYRFQKDIVGLSSVYLFTVEHIFHLLVA